MSNVVFELFAKLGLDSSDYEKGLDNAKGKATSAGSLISNGLKTIGKVGAVALGAATTAVGAFATSSIKAGSDFDKSMSQVAATMGKTMDEMQNEVGSVDLAWGTFSGNLREYAQEMGRNTAFSATQAADALNYMALAGYDTQTSMQMLPNVLNLAAAGSMDLARASDMVTDTQTAFGISLERTSQMVDEMAKAASTGNTSVEQLGDAFLVVGGLAQEMNGGMVQLSDGTTATYDNVQELEIALTAMANAGIKGSEAGTHMRNMLLKLASPTEDGYKAFTALGVSVFDSEGKMRSLAGIMEDLDGAMAELTQEEKLQAISDIFNTRDTAAAEALLNAVGDDWASIAESILDADGAAQQMADTQLDNLAGDVTLFKSALEGAQIAVSDQLTPTLRQFVQFGTDGLSRLTDAFQKGGITGAMAEFGTILSEGITMVTEMLPEAINAGMELLGAVGQGILDNLPVIVDAAVQIVVMLVQGLVQALPELATGVVTLITSLGQSLSDNAETLLEAGRQLLSFIWDGIRNNLPSMLESGAEIISNLVNGFLENYPAMLEAVYGLILEMLDYFLSSMPQFLETGVNLLFNIVNGIINNLPQIVQAVVQIITQFQQTIIENLPQILQKGIEILGQLIAGLIQAIPQLIAAIPQIISAIVDTFGQYDWASIGINLLEGIKNGIMGAIGSVVDAAREAAGAIWDSITGFFDINSPSRKMAWVGEMLDKGLANGIDAYSGLVDDAIGNVSDIADINAEANINGSGANGTNMANNVIINVYAAPGQDEEEIAIKVANVLRDEVVSIGAMG